MTYCYFAWSGADVHLENNQQERNPTNYRCNTENEDIFFVAHFLNFNIIPEAKVITPVIPVTYAINLSFSTG